MTTTATRPVRTVGGDQKHRLTAITGMAGLGLDAIASVAYGPEAIVLVLAAAGSAGLGWTLPVTLAIVVLLGVLIACYRQVIQAFPDGGGAYTVATKYLGRRAGLVAGASLVVDYVLNVAVSVAAGVAALTSAFPVLLPWTTELCVLVLLESKHRVLGPPVARYVKSLTDEHVVVLIGEIEPAALWERMLATGAARWWRAASGATRPRWCAGCGSVWASLTLSSSEPILS